MDSRSYHYPPRQSSPLVSGGNLSSSVLHSNFRSFELQSISLQSDGDYTEIEKERARFYGLDLAMSDEEYWERQNKNVKSHNYKSSLDKSQIQRNLPYTLESLHDKALYLSHIVSHLYIAVESLDLLGGLPISASEFKLARDSLKSSGIQDLTDDQVLERFEQHLYHDEPSDDDDDDGDSDDDIDTGRSTPVNKMSSSSAAIINARHWSIELKTIMMTNFPIPILLRASLCKVYYAICLSQGQDISSDIFIGVYQKLLEEKLLLQEYGLTLDWVLAYNMCIRNFPHESSLLDRYDKTAFKKLLNICFMSNTFFDGNAVSTMFSKLMAYFSTSNASLAMSCLYGLLPMHFEPFRLEDGVVTYAENDVRRYIPSLFNIWSSVNRAENVDLHIVALFSRINEYSFIEASKPMGAEVVKLGNFGILDEIQFKTLVQNLLTSLNIAVLQTTRHPSTYFHSFANLLVFSIVGDASSSNDCTIATMRVMFNSLRSFVHPSNSGPWSGLLSRLILSIVSQYHKRLQMEKDDPVNNIVSIDLKDLPELLKLNETTNRALTQMVLPLIQTGVHSKKDSVVNQYISSLSLLARVHREHVLDAVLVDCYSSLESTTSSHRLRVVLKELAAVMRYMVSSPLYRVHVVRLLMETLPGIDSNDLVKSIQTLHLISVTATYIPFIDLSENSAVNESIAYDFTQQHITYLEEKFYGSKGPFDIENIEFFYEEDYEKLAFISSTSYFKEFIKSFCSRVFLLLENIPDPLKTSGGEAKIVTFIPKTFQTLTESLSDDCFNVLSSQVLEFVSDKVLHTLSDVVGCIIAALVKRDAKTQFPKFMTLFISRIKEEIHENGSGSSRGEGEVLPRDQLLLWYTILLSYAISQAGAMVVTYKSELHEISDLLLKAVRGPVSVITSLIPYQLLTTTTTTRLIESRIIPNNIPISDAGNAWGGYQFDEKRFSPDNLKFGWHLPNPLEIDYAISFFEMQSNECMTSVLLAINSFDGDDQDTGKGLLFTDKLTVDLLTLGRCIAGVSHLFDPSFREQIDDASKPLMLKRKLDSLEQFRKNYGTYESSGKSTPINKTGTSSPVVQSNDTDPGISYQGIHSFNANVSVEAENALEDVIMEDDSSHVAEIPISTKLTPSPSHGEKEEIAESLNAVLSFKNRKIYYSNYYFGEDKAERSASMNYVKLHELRDEIGRFLHKVHQFFAKEFQNNTKLIKTLLEVIEIWVCDVGSERILNVGDKLSLNFDYLESIQYIRRMDKPFTRITFGLLLEKYHRQRLNLFAGSRILTPMDKLLLTDIMELASSSYANISYSSISVLNTSMKLVLGSYTVLVTQLINILQDAILKGDEKVVQHALSVFNSKRFKGKISSDFQNLPLVIKILNDCMLMESNVQVSTVASKLFATIVNKIKIPSSVCDIKGDYVATIRPPDEYIDLEIRALQAAKSKKRQSQLNKIKALTAQLLEICSPSKFWKLNYFNLSLLINIQTDMEVPLHEGVCERLIEFTLDTHPAIFRLCLKGLSGIFSKVKSLSSFDYDLLSIYTKDHIPSESELFDVRPSKSNGGNYTNAFKDERSNFASPSFYIDNKRNFCWLFWGDEMYVVRNQFYSKLHLHDHEQQLLEGMGSKIDENWIKKVVKLLIQEAETDGGFHTNDVQLVSSIITLTSSGFIPSFTNEAWFEIIESIYEADDKDSHLIVCELIAGILVSNCHTTEEFSIARDKFVAGMLKRVLQRDINLETRGIWIVFSWWIPGNSDIRRFPLVTETLMEFIIDKQSDSSFNDATRLMILKHIVASTSFRFPKMDKIIRKCFDNMDHPYQLVREQIASLMTALFMIAPINPQPNLLAFVQSNDVSSVGEIYFKPNELFDTRILQLFETLRVEKEKVKDFHVPEMLKTTYIYTSRTALKFLKSVLATSSSAGLVPYLSQDIIPFLLDLAEMREVCMLAGIAPQQVLVMISYIPFRKDQLSVIIDFVTSFDIKSTVWHNIQVLGLFVQLFYLKQYLLFTETQRDLIFEFVFGLLFHEQVEIRETGAKILISIIHIWDAKDIDLKIAQTQKRFTKILTKNRKLLSKNQSTDEAMIKLHGATLGLGAIIEAFPYITPIPRWVPSILTILANKCSNLPGSVGKAAKDSLSKFKKNRQDTWHIDSKSFTPEELEDLEGVLWTSYFV